MTSNSVQTAAAALVVDDVTKASSNAEFRNDVQLAQYRSKHNLELAKDFIFTRKAAAGRKSSTELLKLVCEAFMPGAAPNRFVFIATYGHGKSHFAVAAANYFGKAADSPEASGVMARIRNALQDASRAGFFDAFKRNNKPALILILRGDEPSDLQTKFFRAVEEALSDASHAEHICAPFWYADAAQFLEGIASDAKAVTKANAFLGQHQLDVQILLEKVKAQESSTFDMTRDLCLHLYHHTPDFGTGLSLKDGVQWLGNNLVGKDKPYGGVLILFDEFSSFVWDYALRIQNRPGAPLQDLLNGVESMRNKVAFVAFAQRDPELVAKSLLSGDSLQSLTTQLNRLPKPQHHQLHSSLEEVLAAYLKQHPDAWAQLLRNSSFTRVLGQASDLCFDVFSSRYEEVLEWDVEHFQEVVSQGCFPLHPATTALLSSVELETTNNPRSVLGFVTKHLDELRGRPAYEGSQPNWILPVTLVDYFKEMLGQKSWDDFVDAVNQAGGADATREQLAILKAMLLQSAAKVATKGAYDRVIALFSGFPVHVVTAELKALAASCVIRYDAVKSIYTFWPAGKGGNKVDQLLSEKLSTHSLDRSVMDVLNERLKAEGLIVKLPVPVAWGHSDDWQADQYLISRDMLNEDSVHRLTIDTTRWTPEAPSPARGVVLWPICESAEDAAWVRDAAADLLAKAFPDQNVSVLIMMPTVAHPELSRQLLRFYGLTKFSNSDIAEVGKDQFSALWQLTAESLKSSIKSLKENVEVHVPAAFSARIQAIRAQDLDSVLSEIFKMAYGSGPKRWFTHYKNSSARLRNATARVATYLVSNALDTPDIFAADNVARDVTQQLKTEWALLATDLRIQQPPIMSNVRPAWRFLDTEFAPGERSKLALSAVTKLLNAPYGFDYNTATLVLAAWLGFHRHDLEISVNSQLRPLKNLVGDLKPKEFVELLANASIRQADADAIKNQIRELLSKVDRGTFSRREAQDAQQLFSQALERDDVDQQAAIKAASEKLADAQARAEGYDVAVTELESRIDVSRGVGELIRLLVLMSRLQRPELVTPDRPAQSELRFRLLARLKVVTESSCKQYEHLDSVANFTRNEEQLQLIRKALDAAKLPEMVSIADSSLTELAATKERLEKAAQDQRSAEFVDSIEERGSITQLRKSIAAIESLEVFSDGAKKSAEKKLDRLRLQMNRLNDLRLGIPKRLDEVQDLRSLEAVKTDLLRNVNLLDAPETTNEVQQSLSRCEHLRELFEHVTSLHRSPISTPEDGQCVIAELRKVLESCNRAVSPIQAKVVADAIAGVELETTKRSEDALHWLEKCEKAIVAGERFEEIAASLTSPPSFLSRDYDSRLEQAKKTVQELKERRQQEATSLATLNAISTKGTLEELRRQVAVVEGLPVYTLKVQQCVDSKLADLNRELKRLASFKEGIGARIESVRDLPTLDDVQSDILRHLALFEGTPDAAPLIQGVETCRQLRNFFESVNSYRHESVRTPEDASRVSKRLQALAADPELKLSSNQQQLLEEAVAAIDAEVVKKSNAALQWLNDCETAADDDGDEQELLLKLKNPPPFLSTEHSHRIEALAAVLAERLDRRRKEASLLHALSTIPERGSFSELAQRISMVQSLAATTPVLQRTVEAKVSALHKELARLQAFSAGLSGRLDAVCDVNEVEAIRTDVLRNLNLYDEASESSQLQQALTRCEYLRGLFEGIAACLNNPIETPAEAQARIEKLREYGNSANGWVSTTHRSILSKEISKIVQIASARANDAGNWLSRCEKEASNGSDPVELAEKLKSPPPFLPDEVRARYGELVAETNHRIDDDAVLLVLKYFRRIHDTAKRSECLDRLSAMITEG